MTSTHEVPERCPDGAIFGPWMGGGTWDAERLEWAGGASLSRERRLPGRSVSASATPISLRRTVPSVLRSTGFFGDEAIERAASLIRESRKAEQQSCTCSTTLSTAMATLTVATATASRMSTVS